MKKILYIILDGLGDLPVEELGHKTPLETAFTPNLDRLAQQGMTGSVYPSGKGVIPESDTAVISLLGYDAPKFYSGRGPLECFAEGLVVHAGDLALRVNFATLEADAKTIKDRRVARDLNYDEACALAKEINSKITLSHATFEFKNTVGHRAALVIRGMRSRLSGRITDTDPVCAGQNSLQESMPMPGYEDSAEDKEAAGLLNEFTRKAVLILNESPVNKKRVSQNLLPANAILSRDAGDHLPKFPSIESIYNLKFGAFVQMPLERGIALLTGIDIIEVPSSTGHLDVDYQVWAKIALDSITKYAGIYVHIKGPDEAGHDGDFKKKKEIIETIDRFFFAGLLAGLDIADTVIAVTADHSTVCKIQSHSPEPVPLLVCGGNIKPDGSLSFSEKAARLGSLGEINGQDILPLLVKFAHS